MTNSGGTFFSLIIYSEKNLESWVFSRPFKKFQVYHWLVLSYPFFPGFLLSCFDIWHYLGQELNISTMLQGLLVYLLVNLILKIINIYRCYTVSWRINKLLLPHNLYPVANHVLLFYCSCWHPFLAIMQTQRPCSDRLQLTCFVKTLLLSWWKVSQSAEVLSWTWKARPQSPCW